MRLPSVIRSESRNTVSINNTAFIGYTISISSTVSISITISISNTFSFSCMVSINNMVFISNTKSDSTISSLSINRSMHDFFRQPILITYIHISLVSVWEVNCVLFNSMLKYVINRLMHAFFHFRTVIILRPISTLWLKLSVRYRSLGMILKKNTDNNNLISQNLDITEF